METPLNFVSIPLPLALVHLDSTDPINDNTINVSPCRTHGDSGSHTQTQSRKLLEQLRVSAHKFPIEKERYENIPREKRTCKICKSNLIGDEFHYLFECHDILIPLHKELFS